MNTFIKAVLKTWPPDSNNSAISGYVSIDFLFFQVVCHISPDFFPRSPNFFIVCCISGCYVVESVDFCGFPLKGVELLLWALGFFPGKLDPIKACSKGLSG